MTLIEIPGLEAALAKSEATDHELAKAARAIAAEVGTPDHSGIKGLLCSILQDYYWHWIDTDVEAGTKARESLVSISHHAAHLAGALEKMGWGAMNLLARANVQMHTRAEARIDDLPEKGPHTSGPPTLFGAPEDVPEKDSHTSGPLTLFGAPENVQAADTLEWSRGGLWVIQLKALAAMARTAQVEISEKGVVGKGKHLDKYLFGGTSEDWLGGECRRQAELRGWRGQRVPTLMYQAVFEAVHGELKVVQRKPNGKGSRQKSQAGRKKTR